jgi:catecholate siderophore receptor
MPANRARNTPPYTFNLWSTYKLTPQWKVGGGLEAKAHRYAYNPSGTGAIPDPAGSTSSTPTQHRPMRAGMLMALLRTANAGRLRLNVKNLFNQLYYDALYDNGVFAGSGHTAHRQPDWRAQVLSGSGGHAHHHRQPVDRR